MFQPRQPPHTFCLATPSGNFHFSGFRSKYIYIYIRIEAVVYRSILIQFNSENCNPRISGTRQTNFLSNVSIIRVQPRKCESVNIKINDLVSFCFNSNGLQTRKKIITSNAHEERKLSKRAIGGLVHARLKKSASTRLR